MNRCPYGGFVFTSNVDGQFQKAGYHEERIVECHGSIHHLQGIHSGTHGGKRIVPVPADMHVAVNAETFRADDPLPSMPVSGTLARPAILMFGDAYWVGERTREQQERMAAWLRSLGDETKVVVVDIGSGTQVPTARLTGARIAQAFPNGKLIRINPRESETMHEVGSVAPGAGVGFDEGALPLIPELAELVMG